MILGWVLALYRLDAGLASLALSMRDITVGLIQQLGDD
jgi:hypothetical protein